MQKADPFQWAKPIDTGNFRRRVFHPACEAVLGRRIRLHDSPHTAGSLWIAAGWNLFDVSRTLGHSSVDFSMRTYAKQLDSSGQRNANLGLLQALPSRHEPSRPLSDLVNSGCDGTGPLGVMRVRGCRRK